MPGKHIENKACPKCSTTGEGKSLSVYEDGEYCNECHYTSNAIDDKFYKGDIREIQSRSLSAQALGKYQVQVTNFTGHLNKDNYVHDDNIVIFNFYKNGKIDKQKIRSLEDKQKCTQVGNTKSRALFGQQAFTPSKKIPIVVTEGEFDAVAIHQAMNYPAVSVGACTNAVKYLAENLEWLSGWAHVVLCFDSDEAGKKALDEAIPVFEIGKVRVAHLPLKDANDMVMAGREEELKRCIWNAEIMKPSTIVSPLELLEEVVAKPCRGAPWPFQAMTDITYGMQPGTMYTIAAAEAVGKTLFLHELVFGVLSAGTKVGLFSFEQAPASTLQRMIGTKMNRALHLPNDDDAPWDAKEMEEHLKEFEDKLFLYNNRGTLSLESILLNIRYLVKCYGVELIIIDNLTALSSTPDTQGKYTSELNYIIQAAGAFSSLCVELGICIMLVTHVNNDTIGKSTYVSTKAAPEGDAFMDLSASDMDKRLNPPGMTWESGRVPSMQNIYCGGALRKLSDFVFVLSRNRVSEDTDERLVTKVKTLKARLDSSKEGKTFRLTYDERCGRLMEEGLEKEEKYETYGNRAKTII